MSSIRRYDPYRLGTLDLFAECTHKELDMVSALLTPVNLEAGQVLMREGSAPREAFIVGSGSLQVTIADQDALRTVGMAKDGEPLGEMSLLHDTARGATVTAVTKTTLYVATPREFRSLLGNVPSFESKIVEIARKRQLANAA